MIFPDPPDLCAIALGRLESALADNVTIPKDMVFSRATILLLKRGRDLSSYLLAGEVWRKLFRYSTITLLVVAQNYCSSVS